ncbi:hypothetical protein GUI43_06242 [Micromonospora noduli]|nr:hypothetical protein GUI43_06242 [Micromonospora noduli]
MSPAGDQTQQRFGPRVVEQVRVVDQHHRVGVDRLVRLRGGRADGDAGALVNALQLGEKRGLSVTGRAGDADGERTGRVLRDSVQ